MFARFTNNKSIKDLVEELAGAFLRQGNICFYVQYKGVAEYIPLYTLSLCAGYRYLFDNSIHKVVLTRGDKDYYEFNQFSSEVLRPEDVVDEMATQTVFRKDLFAEETYCKSALGWEAVYLIDNYTGICADDEIMQLAEELYNKMVEASLPA